MEKPKIIVILGPTASGKTDLAIKLAKEFNGEIISADSRQVYKKMTVGTAKPEGKWEIIGGKRRFVVNGIPHYLMDIMDPGKIFTVAEFKRQATELIYDIISRGKLPFIVGGTGLQIWSVVDNLNIPSGEPNKKLRESFESKTAEQLFAWLKKIDPDSADRIDKNNKRRLVRALEVCIGSGMSFASQRTVGEPFCEALQIGIKWPLPELRDRIAWRVEKQWESGFVQETKNLLKKKYSFDLPSMTGIGYKEIESFLRGEMTEPETKQRIKRATSKYARRQMTWFRRDQRIKWIEKDSLEQAKKLVREFIK